MFTLESLDPVIKVSNLSTATAFTEILTP